jgi:hypothetical protein
MITNQSQTLSELPRTTCSQSSESPETAALWEKECCSGRSWYQIAENLKLHAREMERERNEFLSLISAIRETASAPMAPPGPWDFFTENAGGMARELAAQESESTTDSDG